MTEIDAYLNTFTNWEPRLDQAGVSSFSVERMDALLKVFRHPESALLFAHIAGSKGKGSTAAFLASILRAAGYRTGLYTSPHLYSYHERMRILEPKVKVSPAPFEGAILPREFEQRLLFHREGIDRLRASGVDVTYYELMTALAMAHFAAKGVKVVVLETGLGGRLDATNVFETSVCGITPIGLEHTAILGNTLGKIAVEKASIIKASSQRAAFAPQSAEVMAVLMDRASVYGIIPTLVGADMPVDIEEVSLSGTRFNISGRRDYHGVFTQLSGEHQAYNAALAIAMAEDLETYGLFITEESVIRGIAETVWPGRFEIFPGNPTLVVDCAHTVESARACAQAFMSLFPGRRAVLLLGMSGDKNIAGVCRELSSVAERVVVVKTHHPRAFEFSVAMLEEFFPNIPSIFLTDTVVAKAEALRLAGQDGIVLAAGSVFLAAEVRP